MRLTATKVVSILIMASFFIVGHALADPELQRVTADQAFDAMQTQTDPATGEPMKVMLVDVRTRAEYFWVGTPCKVNAINLDDDTAILPDLGKARLVGDGRMILFRQDGQPQLLPVCKIKSVDLAPIAVNIPYMLWDEGTATTALNEDFGKAVEALALEQNVQVVIFFCRSGGRSGACLSSFDKTLFDAIYEIDQPDQTNGHGGFEGPSYSNVFLGYRGFPGRHTQSQEPPSVSWTDASLPIKTGVNPFGQ